LRARGVLRRDGRDLLNGDRKSTGPVHAVSQLRADLGHAVAKAFRRVAREVTLSAMSQAQGGEREFGLGLRVGLGSLFRADTFVGLRRQSLDNDVDRPGAQQGVGVGVGAFLETDRARRRVRIVGFAFESGCQDRPTPLRFIAGDGVLVYRVVEPPLLASLDCTHHKDHAWDEHQGCHDRDQDGASVAYESLDLIPEERQQNAPIPS